MEQVQFFITQMFDGLTQVSWQDEPWLRGEAGLEYLKPPPNDFLQKWPVSERVNSSRPTQMTLR